MKWLNVYTTVYNNHTSIAGRRVPMCEVLNPERIKDIIALLHCATDKGQKRILKAQLPCFTPSAEMLDRKTTKRLTGLLQIDFDAKDLEGWDVEHLKNQLFKLPFLAYAARSCSGRGLFLLIAIAESERLSEYAQHVFAVFAKFGLKADTSKGRNASDLRYCTYDPKALCREEVEPLNVQKFRTARTIVLSPKVRPSKQDFNKIKRYVQAIEKLKLDFAPTYEDWVSACFSLAEFGKAGRSLFHRSVQFSDKYDFDSSDDLFTNALERRDNSASIGTFIKRCKTFGLSAQIEFFNL